MRARSEQDLDCFWCRSGGIWSTGHRAPCASSYLEARASVDRARAPRGAVYDTETIVCGYYNH